MSLPFFSLPNWNQLLFLFQLWKPTSISIYHPSLPPNYRFINRRFFSDNIMYNFLVDLLHFILFSFICELPLQSWFRLFHPCFFGLHCEKKSSVARFVFDCNEEAFSVCLFGQRNSCSPSSRPESITGWLILSSKTPALPGGPTTPPPTPRWERIDGKMWGAWVGVGWGAKLITNGASLCPTTVFTFFFNRPEAG